MSFDQYSASLIRYPDLGFSLDTSLLPLSSDWLSAMQPKVDKAFADMAALESGAIANPDEGRMVGHYWLRAAELAPNEEIRAQINEPLQALKDFADKVHTGQVAPPGAPQFRRILLIGIGGSALGPQLVDQAIGQGARLPIHFFDNTDPAGIDHTLASIGSENLCTTLVLVISKSGGTPETRNGMVEAKAAFDAAGLDFGKHAVAITGTGSKLDQFAQEHSFIETFPMEDWVGGRTSVMSTVGLVPAALQGIDIDEFLAGAAAMDRETRKADVSTNAAMRLALCWHAAGNGKGEKDMVVLPYKDSLVLFSKYLQQLVMESLGKELDLEGNTVNQGIAVYGNKGSTDQHAYVQQLRDGVANFFATFIEVRKGRDGDTIEVEPGSTSADFLQGFLRGSRKALHESGRPSITISIPEVNPFQLGTLIGLFERAVSFYASLVNINAYHQPGVEAGKKAAAAFLETLHAVRSRLVAEPKTATEIAYEIDGDPEEVYHCLTHLAGNGEVQISLGEEPKEDSFSL
ncbi:glucose-6-phosphate isomerase [Haloferula rosea]|uniref:Glucose-6-phosphate isomerase n=1 Tax=Haloferula rosea TaxID=490093 RepID=A0A934RAD1_9BACT|nr:glucose-6-phosphate isomerase [Haloferula rosea]MBK1825987.1 glucose-6-phosphate isomerase [Haloferula rosea]